MRELFSGVPAQKRNRRLLMPVQAFIDDSQTDGQVLVFAGYLAAFDQWEKFSVDWQELLDMPPRWERFKMADIAGSKDKERWERAGWFYRVVERYAGAFVAVSVDINAFHEAVKDAGFPAHKMWDPYVFAHRALLDATIQHQHELGIAEPVDFIFDKFGKKKLIEEGWEVFKATCRPSLRDRISKNDPRFESDDDFLPLQAADMLAWHAREHWLKHGAMTQGGPVLLSWKAKRNPHGYVFEFGRKNLPDVIREMRGRTAALFTPRVTFSINFHCDLSDPDKRRGGAQNGDG